jgi:hypothetical protein
MNKSFVCMLAVLIASLTVVELGAQTIKLDRWAMGSGGMVGSTNSNNVKMSGMVGQFAIEKVKGTYQGRELNVWQGFWVPTGITTDVETPNEPSAGNQLWNYPNPVTNQTTIRFQLPGTSNVTLKVYNVSGQLMKVLVDGVVEAGQQEAIWDVTDSNGEVVGSGSYLYELSVSPAQMAGFETFQPFTLRKVMVVVK